jgi:hypothetical protein
MATRLLGVGSERPARLCLATTLPSTVLRVPCLGMMSSAVRCRLYVVVVTANLGSAGVVVVLVEKLEVL